MNTTEGKQSQKNAAFGGSHERTSNQTWPAEDVLKPVSAVPILTGSGGEIQAFRGKDPLLSDYKKASFTLSLRWFFY